MENAQVYLPMIICVAIMALSAWFLGDENRNIRALARVGIVVGGAGFLYVTLMFAAMFAAALVIIIPVLLVMAWWNGVF